VEGGAGNVLDPFHQLDQQIVIGAAHRREADAAVAHDRGGHAVVARRRHAVRPGGLTVVVGVDVDEAGRHQGARRVDLAPRGAAHAADLDDASPRDRDIGRARSTAGAVDDRTPRMMRSCCAM
jgi:hypothetical protein